MYQITNNITNQTTIATDKDIMVLTGLSDSIHFARYMDKIVYFQSTHFTIMRY